jgi:mutator protein MutT
MNRRHLQFILSGPNVEHLEALRRRWDPVMAARAPAHLTLVYPEEVDDESLLFARALKVANQMPSFCVALGEVSSELDGDGGVWFLVKDLSGSWSSLREKILSSPSRRLDAKPHVTIVHPRTSSQGRKALASLSTMHTAGTFTLDEIVYTDTSETGMRVLERFPLQPASLTRVVGAVLRREGKVLLCLRTRDRASFPGVWDIPGGHVEATETLQRALSRELKEELGIDAHLESSMPYTVRRVGQVELSVFVIDQWSGDPSNCALEEHDEVRWISLAELTGLPLAHPSFAELLTRLLEELPPAH